MCLCVFSFLHQYLRGFRNRSFASLGRLIPRYFILFHAVVNGIFPLISISNSSLLVYCNGTNYCVLILYPATLPNALMNSASFLVVCLRFSMHSITPSGNSESIPGFSVLHSLPEVDQTYPLRCWCNPTIASSVAPFSFAFNLPSSRVFANESGLCIRWPKYWSFSQSFQWIFRIYFLLDWLV